MDRRNFFKRGLKTSFIHPPYYNEKSDFANCLECEEKSCAVVCDEKIIHIEDGYPVIKFGVGGCTFCDECAESCEKGVLKVEYKRDKLDCDLVINPKLCLAWNNTICFSCLDICPERAILFKGVLNPVIDYDKCTNCGFCISVCPSNSIYYN